MPPTRVACFWRVGALRGLRFDALGVRCLSPAPCAAFAFAVLLLVGKPPKGDFEASLVLFGASEGAVEALLAASPGCSNSNSAYCGCSALA